LATEAASTISCREHRVAKTFFTAYDNRVSKKSNNFQSSLFINHVVIPIGQHQQAFISSGPKGNDPEDGNHSVC
jgi:hypothetical protein